MKNRLFKIIIAAMILLTVIFPLNAFAADNKDLQKDFEKIVVKAIENQEETVNIEKLKISSRDRKKVGEMYFQMLRNNPKLFYVNVSVQMSFFPNGHYKELILEYLYNSKEISKMQSEFDARTKDALTFINSKMSDAEKALAMYDYIVLQNAYDRSYAPTERVRLEQQSAYGGLVKRSTVCNGYAKAYKALMDAEGVDTIVVDSDSMSHAWNMVKIYGKWYHVDTTYGDPGCAAEHGFINDDYDLRGYVNHDNFLFSDAKAEELGYYEWNESAPKAKDKYFDNLWVKDVSSGMFNVKGVWYYRLGENIFTSDWKNTNNKALAEALGLGHSESYSHLGFYGNRLYYNEGSCIYSVNLKGKDKLTLVDAKDKKLSDPQIYEFNILEGKLYYGVVHDKGYKTFSIKL